MPSYDGQPSSKCEKKISLPVYIIRKGERRGWLSVSSCKRFAAMTIDYPGQQIGGLYSGIRVIDELDISHLVRPSALSLFALKPNLIDGIQERLIPIKEQVQMYRLSLWPFRCQLQSANAVIDAYSF
jgi:hypothetical protein